PAIQVSFGHEVFEDEILSGGLLQATSVERIRGLRAWAECLDQLPPLGALHELERASRTVGTGRGSLQTREGAHGGTVDVALVGEVVRALLLATGLAPHLLDDGNR